jgi:hypothetical protein
LAVEKEDTILGIPKSNLLDYYTDTISGMDTNPLQLFGPLLDINLGSGYEWILGAYAAFIKYELIYREANNLLLPTTYETGDLTSGKQTVVSTYSSSAVNPHTGAAGAYVPVQPSTYNVTLSGTTVSFDTALPIPGDLYKSYIVVGPVKATLRAYAINPVNGQRVYSQDVDILVSIKDSSIGLYNIDTINAVPSGLFTNSNFWDQLDQPLEIVTPTVTGMSPIGWRLPSTGITIASALNSLTFLDLNKQTAPSDTISHEFTVTT